MKERTVLKHMVTGSLLTRDGTEGLVIIEEDPSGQRRW
jgi:hypothetical protein